jgi:hypothetical protein
VHGLHFGADVTEGLFPAQSGFLTIRYWLLPRLLFEGR